MELPGAFLDSMKELLGDEYEAYLESFDEDSYRGLRVNRMKMDACDFRRRAPFSLEEIPWASNGFYYGDRDAVTKHPWYYAGVYYVQEPSAMVPASRLPIEPGDFVLDLCAAPGGKATELGARLGGTGMLLANDVSVSRARALLKNLEMAGVTNMYVTSENSGKLLKAYPAFFDKILVDAPCSGEGMFRRDPSMVKDWEEKGVAYYVEIQRTLLLDAAAMLKPGGMLLYSTCTFSVEENEKNIAWLLERRPELSLAEPEWDAHFSPGAAEGFASCIRLFPHRAKGEGHFAALLKKNADAPQEMSGLCKKNSGKVCSAKRQDRLCEDPRLAEFLSGIAVGLNGDLFAQNERMYLIPENTQVRPSLRYLRTGLYLGDLKKGRFEPSQALALCLRDRDYIQSVSFEAEDGRVRRYLKGETLDLAGTDAEHFAGWVLVCVDGLGLGWGRAVNGTLRNKYHAGWRMQS